LVESSDSDREVLESGRADMIFNLENQKRQDFLHHRNSGVNHIHAKLASDNTVTLGFSFTNILQEKKRRARLIGRIMQNIRLARKFKTKTVFASFAKSPYAMRAWRDMISALQVFGMTPESAKKSLEETARISEKNRKQKSENYIAEGIRIVD
jgi:RNase P/RNase MRP subunit p30